MTTYRLRLLPLLLEIGLIAGLAAVLFARWQREQLSFYIHPRFIWLVVLAAIVLSLLALFRVGALVRGSATDQPTAWLLLLLSVPLTLALLVPPRPLNGETLLSRGTDLNRFTGVERRPRSTDSREWDLLTWSYELSLDPARHLGAPARLIGFVVADPALPAGTTLLARYVLTCCAADGSAVGLLIDSPEAAALPTDSWVEVTGVITLRPIDGVEQPVLEVERLTSVDQPTVPYLFP